MTKIVLVSKSQGTRGDNGKKKVYEIVVEGNKVVVSWGMAEKANRQSKTEWFGTELQATWFASDKKYEKLNKGYEIAYTA
jgi:predicted DNA-binding WGR domain protein